MGGYAAWFAIEQQRRKTIVTELDKAIEAVVDAVEVEGPEPRLHRKILRRHRKEWPTLHNALNELRRTWHKNPS